MNTEQNSGAEQVDLDAVREASTEAPEAPILGQRQTRQRSTILRVIQEAGGPLSIPEIHAQAQADLPGMGVATVYRTLKLLNEARAVNGVILPSGETRYERAGLGHHEHFQCRSCSQVFDLSVCPVHIPAGTVLPGGFVVEDHEMTIYGLCSNCANPPAPAAKVAKTRRKKQTI